MFLNDGKVVFSLFIILFKFSGFNFCWCDSVYSGLFGCALLGCALLGGVLLGSAVFFHFAKLVVYFICPVFVC